MKKAIWIFTVIFFLGIMNSVSTYSKQVYVKPYTKKDGTHVSGHYRNYPVSKSHSSSPFISKLFGYSSSIILYKGIIETNKLWHQTFSLTPQHSIYPH